MSSIRAPLGATKGSCPILNTVGTPSVQNPECAHVPRLSSTVTCSPAYRSRRSATRAGSFASLKLIRACEPSQNGLMLDAPQRHNAIRGRTSIGSPSHVDSDSTFVSRYGPLDVA